MNWILAGEDKEVIEKTPVAVNLNEKSIALIRKDGKIHAISNKCAHMKCLLSGGTLDGYGIKCPCHDWKFDIRTGEFLDASEIKIKTFDCRIKNGKIFVKMEE